MPDTVLHRQIRQADQQGTCGGGEAAKSGFWSLDVLVSRLDIRWKSLEKPRPPQ